MAPERERGERRAFKKSTVPQRRPGSVDFVLGVVVVVVVALTNTTLAVVSQHVPRFVRSFVCSLSFLLFLVNLGVSLDGHSWPV